MRKNIILFLLVIVSITSFSQQTTKSAPLTKAEYLKKSQNQKTAAWILLGGGLGLSTLGVASWIIGTDEEIVGIIFTGEKSNKYEAGAILFFTGLACMGGSIPLFISSSNNKKKAANMTASFKMESGSFVRQATLIQSEFPALAVKINF